MLHVFDMASHNELGSTIKLALILLCCKRQTETYNVYACTTYIMEVPITYPWLAMNDYGLWAIKTPKKHILFWHLIWWMVSIFTKLKLVLHWIWGWFMFIILGCFSWEALSWIYYVNGTVSGIFFCFRQYKTITHLYITTVTELWKFLVLIQCVTMTILNYHNDARFVTYTLNPNVLSFVLKAE